MLSPPLVRQPSDEANTGPPQEALLMKEAMGNAIDLMRQLEQEHRHLDEQLRVLTRRAYLTPDEQRTASELKRKKLSAKDRLHALARGG